MRYAAVFGAMAAGCAVAGAAAVSAGGGWVAAPFAWGASSLGLAALAYAGLGPEILGKDAQGRLPLWSRVVNGPFLLLCLASMRLVHAGLPRAPWNEVAAGVVLGRRPTRRDGRAFAAEGFTAIVDLCAELPATRLLDPAQHYLALPVLDHEAPTLPQLVRAVQWIEAERVRPGGRVLVHCALGRSRSATVIAAWWIATAGAGVRAVDLARIEATLRELRPDVTLSPDQRAQLEAWCRYVDQLTFRPRA